MDACHIFTPGPVAMPKAVLDAGGGQVPPFRNAAFSAVVLECEELLLDLVGAPAGSRVVFLTASGTAAMEAVLLNLSLPHGKVAVVNGGGFGQRFVDIAHCHGIAVFEMSPGSGNLTEVGMFDSLPAVDAVLVNAHETSTGVLYDLSQPAAFCRQRGALHVVDAISMFLTDPLDMTRDAIDALIISSHKGLALAPGLSMVVLSPAAQVHLQDNPKTFYAPFASYLRDGLRGQTPFTPAVGIVLQLQVRLREIMVKGISQEIERARCCAAYFRSNCVRWPVKFYSKHMPNAMTALSPTDGRKARQIVLDLESQFGIYVAANGGALADTVFRVAHMGVQTEAHLDNLIHALDIYYGK